MSHEKKQITKSAGAISLATLVSRIFGYVRDMLIAKFFGTGQAAEAFFVAFRLPNMLRELVAEGAANAAFVPIFSEYLVGKKKEEFWRLVNVIFNLVAVVLALLVVGGVIFSPLLVRILSPGFLADPAKLQLTVFLSQALFIFIFLVGIFAYFSAVLNSLKHFILPASGPALMNLVWIASILLFAPKLGIWSLVIGVILGALAQGLLLLPLIFAKGFRLKTFALHHPQAKKITTLLIPRAIGAGVHHLNIIIDNVMASFSWIVGQGSIAIIYYAYRLIQFPMAIFGISLAQASLPTMSYYVANKDMAKLKETLLFSLRGLFTLIVPSSIGLIVLSGPIVRLLFQRGEFSEASAALTCSVLSFYALGLIAYAGVKNLVNCFYALQDTRTPLKIAFYSLLVNTGLNLLFMFPFKVSGLALATSLASFFNFFLLFIVLEKRIGNLNIASLLNCFWRVLLASLIMAVVIIATVDKINFGPGVFFQGLSLTLTIFIASLTYFIAGLLLGVKELAKFTKWILKRN
jgi:putative peptidoglycan lipid II flippase